VKVPAYSAYKPSGVTWLDEIPDEWMRTPLKRIVAVPITDGPHETPDFVDEGVPFASAESVFDGRVNLAAKRGFISTEAHARYSRKYRPKRDDVFVVKSGSTTGKVAIVDFDDEFNIWSPLAAIRCAAGQAVPKFVFYALGSEYFQRLVQVSWSFGTQPNIGMSVLQNLELALPSPSEQRAIAAFLNRETGRIDRLLGKKRELIERLKEKRTALISRTVTRGLPPAAARAVSLPVNPTLKPTGLDWLGDIPAHWEVEQLKWAIMFQRGHDLPSDEREDGNVPLVTSAGVSASISKAAARGPGLVTGRYGTIGEFYLIETDYWPLNTTLYSIDLRGNHPPFLRYMLMHLSPLFLLNAVKSAVPGVDRNDVHATTTAVPPLPEQVAIANYLDEEMAKLDALVAKVEAAIERLQEYRTALITAAVTGKIDVRKVSP
jgi:type I restriction enzyme S subunit